jgi:hypothetical protein
VLWLKALLSKRFSLHRTNRERAFCPSRRNSNTKHAVTRRKLAVARSRFVLARKGCSFVKDVETTTVSKLNEAVEKAVNSQATLSLEIDLERYQACLDDPALSPNQKAEIIEALWTIITAFVQLGFGVHPVQQACGKPRTELEHAGISESTEVQLGQCILQDEEAPAP